MQTLTFSCPHCSNLMAIGLELLGQQVQCPTCGKVVVAPTSPPKPEPESASAKATDKQKPPDVLFELPKEEDTESIFGEVQDEDVFGSRMPKVEIPEGPSLTPEPTERLGSNFASFAPGMPPTSTINGKAEPAAAQAVPAATPTPMNIESPASEPPAARSAEPAVVSAPPEQWPPADSASNQWRTAASTEPSYASDAYIEKAEIRRPAQTREQRKLSSLMLAILGPYSVIMTILAGYYFIKLRNAMETEHPFAKIPDIRAQFDPAVRRQFTTTFQKMPSPDAELPDKLKVRLGDTIRIGDLQVTPEIIEQGRLKQYTVLKNNQINPQTLSGTALIMRLRLKNVSSDIDFCPTDPFFERYYDQRSRNAKPYTLLELGGKKYYGGPIDFLAIDWKQVKRKYIDGQDNDDKALPPGEERQTVICSDPSDQAVNQAINNSKPTDPITWRVQLRHGLTEFQGKEYSVTGVIGVQFTAADIKKRN